MCKPGGLILPTARRVTKTFSVEGSGKKGLQCGVKRNDGKPWWLVSGDIALLKIMHIWPYPCRFAYRVYADTAKIFMLLQ
jgi:hypothetical protein